MNEADAQIVQTIYEWLRPYQLEYLHDTSPLRIINKSRQIGFSDAAAFEMVITSSGLVELLEWPVPAHNCTVVSKRDDDAKDVISKAKEWIRRLELVEAFRPYLETTISSAHEIKFRSSGYRIISETQNPDAGRSKTGHLYLDEYAFYRYQRQIFKAAYASTTSRPGLRITIICTPNGQGDHFHEIFTDHRHYPNWSRHQVDIYRAVADGHPIDIEEARANNTPDDFAQEFECSFLGGDTRYFDAQLLAEAEDVRPESKHRIVLGIDTASVIDNTAVMVWRVTPDVAWMTDCYILQRMAYESQPGRLGQADIVEALIRELRPDVVSVDKTGDAANQWTRGGGLYALLEPRVRNVTRLVGVTINIGWKNLWVERLKGGMTTGRIKFDMRRRDLVFSNRYLGLPAWDHGQIVNTAFETSPYPSTRMAFGSVHKKWTAGGHQTTFDTDRDEKGHGDEFWAAALGYSCLDVQRPDASLNSKLRAAAFGGSSTASTDYGDYL